MFCACKKGANLLYSANLISYYTAKPRFTTVCLILLQFHINTDATVRYTAFKMFAALQSLFWNLAYWTWLITVCFAYLHDAILLLANVTVAWCLARNKCHVNNTNVCLSIAWIHTRLNTDVDFRVHNATKLTHEHLWFHNFFRGLYPWTPC